MKHEYPAAISYDAHESVYYVNFPDIPNCFTDGKTLREALDNADDVLSFMLYYADERRQTIAQPSAIQDITLGAGEIVALVTTGSESGQKIAV